MSAAEAAAAEWIAAHAARLEPLETAANLALWEAATAGDPDALARSAEGRAAVRRLYSDPEGAATVKALLADGAVIERNLVRQLELANLAFTGNQLSAEMIEDLSRREADLERRFYTFRASFEGSAVSNNELLEVLRTETSGARRRAAWEASKVMGREVADAVRDLIRVRNRGARSLGFRDYYAMELALQEIDEAELFRQLEAFRVATDAPFARLRAEMDVAMGRRFDVSPADLRPWHWEDFFSQEAPALGFVNLDELFLGLDAEHLARRYYAGVGLDVGEVLDRSDLYEREGKDQHAFCLSVDRGRDVRVLCNLRPNQHSMTTLLHELGHAAYDVFLPLDLPYLLRAPAHTMTTESVAMYMGRMTRDPEWLTSEAAADLDEDDRVDVARQLRTAMLVSARWMLVMIHFEKALYEDPDREDLNTLWWKLVRSLQGIVPPEGRDQPDWAAKIHLSLAPVYYHNYLLGEMTASQMGAAIRAISREAGRPPAAADTGAFFRERIFSRGALLHWDALMREATGEPLSPAHFVNDFVRPS